MKKDFYKQDPLEKEEDLTTDTGGGLPKEDDEESEA